MSHDMTPREIAASPARRSDRIWHLVCVATPAERWAWVRWCALRVGGFPPERQPKLRAAVAFEVSAAAASAKDAEKQEAEELAQLAELLRLIEAEDDDGGAR